MFILSFDKSKSKYFEEALKFSESLNCDFDGTTVTIKIPENELPTAYLTMRQLFGIIQGWKSTKATFRNQPVHPYQTILFFFKLFQCESISNFNKKNCLNSCGEIGWGCRKIDYVKFNVSGIGEYNQTLRFWYNFGFFRGSKWVIDKVSLFENIVAYIASKGIDICTNFEQNNLLFSIKSLPDYIIPDDRHYKILYQTKTIKGMEIQIPLNIRHI